TDHGVSRGWILEFCVPGAFRHWKADRRDDFAGLESSLVHAFEELIGCDLAFVGVDRRTQAQHPCRIVSRRIVVGDGATEGAEVTNHPVADLASESGERGDGFLDFAGCGDIRVARHRADGERASVDFYSTQ